jgi:membrane-bound serine protease (ClpP class)
MTPLALIAIYFAAGIALLVLELMLPTHGTLGVLGLLCILIAIGKTFLINEWAGVGFAVATAASVPFVWSAVVKYWPMTPMGRKMVLGPVVSIPEPPPVHIGQAGVAVSGLRPMGVCEFDGQRVEAVTELGTLEANTPVIVTAIHDRRPTVRAANERTS